MEGGALRLPSSQGPRGLTDLIELRGVSKVYGKGEAAVHAFGPVDLAIGEGRFISFLGPSGCGKSTLMLMIAGLLEPSTGSIRVNGTEVEGPRTDIGIMFQDSTLVPWRTVRANVELQLEMRGIPVSDLGERVTALLQSVHLDDFADRLPFELSGGMQQRAAFCQAMVHEPKIVLLDEPLGKLDAMTREHIRADLQGLWMRNRPTVVFVTHSIEEAVQLSTEIAVITPRPGRIDTLIPIELPFPRDLKVKGSPAFVQHVHEIQEIFHGYGVL